MPTEYQTAKGSISQLLSGMEKGKNDKTGIYIYKVKGWDYAAMIETFQKGVELCRREHVPVLFHITEITQPQGHSTSGSHERYKSAERLEWEKEYDCNSKFKEWILANGYATTAEIEEIEKGQPTVPAKPKIPHGRNTRPHKAERDALIRIIDNRSCM